MIRKIFGGILAFIGVLGVTLLLTGGGPLLPHIVGPLVLIGVGLLLLLMKGATSQSPEG